MTGAAGPERALAALGALAGLAGVALSAAAAHIAASGSLETAARFLLAHAPVLMALAAMIGAGLVHRGVARAAGSAIAIGLALFCGDLTIRALAGTAPLPMMAPAGGIILLAGWALVLGAALRGSPRIS